MQPFVDQEASEATPIATSTRRRDRLTYVDGVRALAALFVVLHHIWITTYPDYPRNSGPAIVGWLLYGHVAVAVFIVVSGFSLSIAPARNRWQLKGGIPRFIRRRAWRILPTYWAALALSCVVFGLITPDETGAQVSAKAIAVHGLLLQDVINSPKPNGAFWSIAIEWQIYFLFPLFVWFRRRLGSTSLLAFSTAGVVVVYLAATHLASLHSLLNLTPQFAALFVFGMVAANAIHLHDDARHAWSLPVLSCVAAGLFLLLCMTKGSVWVDAEYFWIDLLVGAATALLLSALAAGRANRLSAVLSGRALRSTGFYSYSIYCAHLPLLWLVWHFGVARWNLTTGESFLALLAIGMPIVIGGSYLFSLVFERPFLTHRSFAAWRDLVRRARHPRGDNAGTIPSPAGGG